MIQYFIIYFNKVIQYTISIFKVLGQVLQILFPGDLKIMSEEIVYSSLNGAGYAFSIRLKPLLYILLIWLKLLNEF